MSPPRAAITGVHGYVPPDVLTNEDLSRMVDTTDAWITERTGVKERHILKGEGLGTSHMASEAVRGLLAKTGTAAAEVDLLICPTTTPDLVFPSTANLICDMVGIRNVGSFDIQAACSGFLYGLTIASQFIETGKYKKIVLVGADKMSALMDYTDRATCVLFGDGAGAVMIEPSRNGYGIVDTVLHSDGSGMPHLHQKAGGSRMPPTAETVAQRLHYVHQEGAAVYKFAIARMAEVATEIMRRNDITGDQVDWLVPHQANRRIIEATADRMGLPMERVMVTIQKYGNTTCATIPLCLWDYESQLKRGDKLVLAAFGGGFTWAGAYVTWGYDYGAA
jgi:3-oxoacyl-[acyl-carrier-protein] synthase III